jgi:hypothetical protein
LGEDRGLDAGAQVKLGQHPGDVRLHGRLPDEQPTADLVVGEAFAQADKDFAFAVGQLVEAFG